MNRLSSPILVLIVCEAFLLLVTNTFIAVQCFPNTEIQDADCSKEVLPPGDPSQVEVDFVLDDLVEYTSHAPGYTFNTGTAHCFGYAKCERRLSPDDCTLCIEEAVDFLENKCSFCIRGEVVMADCRAKYSNQPF